MPDPTENWPAQSKLLPRAAWILVLIIVVAIMLFAGLRPYASFSDEWIEFDSEASVTRFKGLGLATGELPQPLGAASMARDLKVTFNLTLRLPENNRFQILAQLDSPGGLDTLIIGQWRTSIIAINSRDYRNQLGLPRVSANLTPHTDLPVDVTITFTPEETRMDVDGRYAATGEAFEFAAPLTRVSIGNGPDGQHGWKGELSRFAISTHSGPLTGIELAFDQDRLPQIIDISPHASDFLVPSPGNFPDRIWIGAMETGQLLDQNLRDVVINFLGFTPFGFVIAALLRDQEKPIGRSVTVVVALLCGAVFSLGIELTQTFIAGRSPHTHDLILNTLGTLPGSIGFIVIAAVCTWWIDRSQRSIGKQD